MDVGGKCEKHSNAFSKYCRKDQFVSIHSKINFRIIMEISDIVYLDSVIISIYGS